MRLHSLSAASALFLASTAGLLVAPSVGCAPAAGEDGESAAQASTSEDLAAAREIVALLGGEEGKCSSCHNVDATKLRAWGKAMKDVEDACFTPTLSAVERVNCLRSSPTNPSSPFSARRLGLYTTGVGEDSFKELFESAGSAEYAAFKQRTTMPRGGGDALSSAEFAKIKSWVLRGMPQLDEAFAPPTDPVPGPVGNCVPKTTPELAAHLSAMKTEGWGARLADQATPMFGCGSAASPLECLAQLPDVTAKFGGAGVPQTFRQLHEQPLKSRYWVRSSADGRFIGYGLYTSSKVIDLTRPAGAPAIEVAADYDPFFLPSNDGFAFAGSHAGDRIRVCRQSLLSDVTDAASPSISLTESKCASIGNQVYQSIGSALDGDRYFVTWGAHENDDGGNTITAPLPAAFNANATTTFTPMVNDGLSYRAERAVNVRLPGEGDMMLSPSSMLAATRFGDGRKQHGYRIRFVKAQGSGSSLSVQTPLAAEVCVPGMKVNFSFDERFVVTHQYVDRSDPSHASLANKSANIVIVDLATGRQTRITSSRSGVYALYPHFRADGWLYFLVRDMNTSTETMVASDIAIRMAQ